MKRFALALALSLAVPAFPAHALGDMAPEFPAGLRWLNTPQPMPLGSLRGRLVLLDFWTFCCINCMHILPGLSQLEHDYEGSLVVLGVHSAKFTAEGAA